jgi:hypothetical protein
MGSIPDEIFNLFLDLYNPSSRTMALEWAASNRIEYHKISGVGKALPTREADNITTNLWADCRYLISL